MLWLWDVFFVLGCDIGALAHWRIGVGLDADREEE